MVVPSDEWEATLAALSAGQTVVVDGHAYSGAAMK